MRFFKHTIRALKIQSTKTAKTYLYAFAVFVHLHSLYLRGLCLHHLAIYYFQFPQPIRLNTSIGRTSLPTFSQAAAEALSIPAAG